MSPRSRTRSCLALPACGLAALLVLPACGTGDTTAAATTGAPPGPPQLAMPEGALLDYPVDQVGPFHVGYRAWKITYQPKAPSGPREIGINVWYPTLDIEGEHPKYLHAFPDNDVLENATLAPPVDPKGYPVHVHSHGSWGYGGTSSDLMHYFASHGWVAVAPDHTGNTLPEHKDSIPVSIWYLRSMDVSAALDTLAALPAEDPLAGKCLTDRVFLSGHSFGTFTTWATGGATFDTSVIQGLCDDGTSFSAPCTPDDLAVFGAGLGDPRVVAGLPMAGGVDDGPGWFGTSGLDAVHKPYMLMSGTDDPVGAENVWNEVTSDLTWLDFEGGCHQLFALGGCKNFDENLGWSLVDTYGLAFARSHLLADTSPRVAAILDGSEVLSAKVHFQRK